MARSFNFGDSYVNLCLFLFCCLFFSRRCCLVGASGPYNSFPISGFSYPRTRLEPYAWRYIRVDLPSWFSSLSLALESDVDVNAESIRKVHMSSLPLICLRDGGPPLPDVVNSISKSFALHPLSNASIEEIKGHQNREQCYLMQKNITVKLTNEQISPGVWYFGLFNGIGPMRTQSKMIARGQTYYFTANISVEGCISPTLWGPYCNQTVEPLPCAPYDSSLKGSLADAHQFNQSVNNVVYCNNSLVSSCHRGAESKVYSLELPGMVEQLNVVATDFRFDEVLVSNNTSSASEIKLMCFARLGAIPRATLNDFSGNLYNSPLIISSPKAGRWYFTIVPSNLPTGIGETQGVSKLICYTMKWKVLECPEGTAGLNCMWEKYLLQTFLRKDPSAPFESYFLPMTNKLHPDSSNFPLDPLLSNISSVGDQTDAWTYFLADIPSGAAGGNFHIRLTSNASVDYEVYARLGGLPSVDNWDYLYANKTSDSSGSMFFKLYNSSEEAVDFNIFYVKEGTWSFGLRHLKSNGSTLKGQTALSISLERCPQKCSSHGTCRSVVDSSGLTLYSYCFCDRDHGGFDCSIEIVSHQGHIWQSVSLIASNAAAILPAFWALRNKAFAEWILFTSSGISSGLYHACDVGTWCALNFHALQFMDFWLSFMAVVSTFVYLAAIDEVSKRTIHTAVSILTALMAITGATRSANIILVIALGAAGLIIGWMIEFGSNYRSFAFSMEFCLDMHERWQIIRGWLHNLFKTLIRRFHWGFVLAGFITLALAGISWNLESSDSYWIWHSVWHVSIYTSSFLFLCSKANIVDGEGQRPVGGNYELTRQNSSSRGGE